MKEAIDNFVKILVKGDFLLVLFVVMVILVIIFLIYLAKLLFSGKYNDEDIDLSNDIDEFIENTKELPSLKIEEEPVQEAKEVIKEEPTPRKVVQMPIVFDEEKQEEISEDTLKSEINNFENEQEEVAIISAEELDARIKQMQATGEMDEHEREIERYEAEQEDKAVISYDELIKRASTGVVNYETEKDLGGIRISKVDFDKAKTVTLDNRYAKEEAFLEALKEFRRAL